MSGKSKVLSGILAIVMAASTFAGCSKSGGTNGNADAKTKPQLEGPEYLNTTGFPITKQPITLKAMVSKHASQGDYAETMVWKEYEKMTGIKIEWDAVPSSSITERRNLALASGDMPDMFFRASIPEKDVLKYGEQGVFIKMNDLIDQYGPNFKKVMETMTDVKKSIPAYNGNIYSLPGLSDVEQVEINPKLYLNKKWLDRLGLKMPSTTDELYAVFKAFKERDGNGNGNADELPWTAQSWTALTDCLKGAWGLMNRGKNHANVDMDEKTGKLRFIPTDPQYKGVLEYMNKLYKEGLIDQEIFTMNATQLIAKGEQNLVGAFSFTATLAIGNTYIKDYEGLSDALKGPDGEQMWAARRSHVSTKGAFAITSSNKYPEATMRWIDYFYGDEGAKFFFIGIEGKSYMKTPEGNYEFLPEIVNNIPTGSNFDQVISKYVPYAGGGNPAISKPAYFKGGEMEAVSSKAAENMKKYTPKELWGPFSYTMEENDRISSLENDIMSYVNQMAPQFIQGKASLSQWDSYVEQIKKMGLDEYMKIYTAAYERYKKN